MIKKEDSLRELVEIVEKQKIKLQKMINSQESYSFSKTAEERKKFEAEIINLKKEMNSLNQDSREVISKLNLVPKLVTLGYRPGEENAKKGKKNKNYYDKDLPLRSEGGKTYTKKELTLLGLEKETILRIRARNKEENKEKSKKKSSKKDGYSKISSILFSSLSKNLLGRESFKKMEKDLIKANLGYSPTGYLSVVLFSTMLSFFVGGFLFLFFLFFNIGSTFPIISRTLDPINIRLLKVFWILIIVPLGTFVAMYFYPYLEKRATEDRINQEMPFATIHMSAISGSMIDPIKIFEIIVNTGEYPALQKEFTKLLNEINLYGSNFVNALQNSGRNSASKKLQELYNGLATNINSGGDLPNFFEKRSETLLFEHQIAVQKEGKSAETFMDVYISVVIAAPMILMMLLLMMKLSGIGLNMSVGLITLIMILVVTIMNIIFLAFLHMKKKK